MKNEESGSSADESEGEERRIKAVLSNLFQELSKERGSDLLHRMAFILLQIFYSGLSADSCFKVNA